MNKRTNKVVVKLDQVTPAYAQLAQEARTYFEPDVARNLKEERKRRVADYLKIAQAYSASHLMAFSQSEDYNNLKIVSLLEDKSTVYFKVTRYLTMQAFCRNSMGVNARLHGYFVIAQGIEKNDPIRRMVDELKKHARQNQHTVRAVVIKGLGDHMYILTQYLIRKEEKPGTTQVRLSLDEIGPRMELKLHKIEDGICNGNAVFHSYIQKTESELHERDERIRARAQLRLERRLRQETNIRNKRTQPIADTRPSSTKHVTFNLQNSEETSDPDAASSASDTSNNSIESHSQESEYTESDHPSND